MGGCHHLLLIYDAPKLSTVYVVKSPVLGLQRVFFELQLSSMNFSIFEKDPSMAHELFLEFSILKKNLDFSEKLPSEGLELVILLHTQY